MPLKILNRKAQDGLIRYAEPFAALAEILEIDFPDQLIEKAWNFLLLAHSHDAINGVTLDKTAEDTAHKLKQVIEIGQVITDMTAMEILKKTSLAKYSQDDILIAVFNTAPRESDQIVEIKVDVAEDKRCRRLRAIDAGGEELSVQTISHSRHVAPVNVQNSRALPFYSDRHTLHVSTGSIPGYGFKIIKLVPDEFYNANLKFWHGTYEQGTQNQGPCKFGNYYLLVDINPDGTYDLESKLTGQRFENLGFYENSGDVGDFWQRVKPDYDQIMYSKGLPARIYLKEDGPLVTTYVSEIIMKVPAKADKSSRFASRRADHTEEIKISTALTLKAGTPYLEVKTTIHNNARDHRLRVGFPTFIDTNESVAMGHFNVDSRPIGRAYENGIRDGEMSTLPMQNFLELSDGKNGLAISNRELIEFEVTEDISRTAYLTLLRCMDVNICTEGRCGTIETGAMGPQCLGEHTFHYAIYPHRGDWQEGDVYQVMEDFVYPPRVYQISKHDKGTLPESLSLLTIDPSSVQIASVKRAQDTDGTIIRFYNPGTETVNAKLKFAKKPLEAFITDLNEEIIEQLDVAADGTVKIEIQCCKIITVLCKF
jgi:mannosylglycerate hydrolase